MELICDSRWLATAVSVALDVTGREHLVVLAKATWALPAPGGRPRPLLPQPLARVDAYYGEPGESPMRHGDDFARFKPRCDVLFDACAHSPDGQPRELLGVGVQVGDMVKRLRVTGERRWRKRLGGFELGPPGSFTTLPLHYGHAFGGARRFTQRGETLTEALLANPVGLGWGGRNTARQLDGEPGPRIEALDDPVRQPDGHHAPMALSAIGRHWQPRMDYAGTYDDEWRENVFPFLPEDFDDQFHQCAPRDQQIPYPTGGEAVQLVHLLPGTRELSFPLPPLDRMGVRILRTDYSTEAPPAHVDTLLFETEAGRFSAVWRASTPIRRRIQEFDTIVVGPIDEAWWQARALGLDGHGCDGCGEEASEPTATAGGVGT